MLSGLQHGGLHAGRIEVAAIWLGPVPEEGVGRVQQALRQGQDSRQGCVGLDSHGLAKAAPALLPDDTRVVSCQKLPLRRYERPAVLRRVTQGVDGPAGGLVGVGQGHPVLVRDLRRAVGAAGNPERLPRLLVPHQPALRRCPPLYHGGLPAVGQLGPLPAHHREEGAGADGEAQPLQVGDGLDDGGACAGHRHLHLALPLGHQVGRAEHQDALEARHVRRRRADEGLARSHLADDGGAPVGFEGEGRAPPLTSVKGSVTTLLDPSAALNPAETLQFHRIIDAQTDRMRELISDLLDVAHIETGNLSVAPGPADVAVLVDEARNAFLSGGGRNSLHIDLAPDLPWVMADRLRIVQVLGNLLSNAARHSPEASSIRVSAVREGVHVAVSVADDGMGVSADLLPLLFRKFSRIDGDDRGSGIAGSGLGLAICKGIVEAHGGRIWAESGGPGLGARFTLTLPAVEEAGSGPAAGPAPLTSRSPRRAAGEQVRVLAVDDDPQALRYVRDALSKAGYTPIVTGDPEEALRLVEEEQPRLALLDLMLPGADGIELMRDILETADVPVIFLSAYGRDELIARAFDMGAADYVVKPFSPTELAARIRAALRRREAPEQAEPTEPYTLGDLEIDYAERGVTVAGRPVRLIAIEYRMLVELSANAGRVVAYEHLLQRIWGAKSDGDVRPMRTVVSSLRRKLGDDADNPTYIFTEPRVGYRMPKGETSEGPEET